MITPSPWSRGELTFLLNLVFYIWDTKGLFMYSFMIFSENLCIFLEYFFFFFLVSLWGELHGFVILWITFFFLILLLYRRKWFVVIYLLYIWPFSGTFSVLIWDRHSLKYFFGTTNNVKLTNYASLGLGLSVCEQDHKLTLWSY